MNEPLLRLIDVEFAYGPQQSVLLGANFSVSAGQRIALCGGNGSGKTTLFHLAVGLLHPTSGQIEAFGEPRRCEADFHEVRRRVGLLFQDSDDQLFCPTVAEDVAFGPLNIGKSRDQARAIVAETLDALGLAGYEHRITHHLSGGERRLVALATVLAMKPEVLLLDEPSNGLDEPASERLMDVLLRLPQAMVIVSHNRDFRHRTTLEAVALVGGRIENVLPE